MKTLILYLLELKSRGLISNYALGGATALIYYFEPFQTQDIDVFIVLENDSTPLVNLAPIYSFLTEKGVETAGEYLIIDGVPVQFLVPYNPLVEEAVSRSIAVSFFDVEVQIPTIEYLMAIMLQTNRKKDLARLGELFEQPELFEMSLLEEIVSRFNLDERLAKIL